MDGGMAGFWIFAVILFVIAVVMPIRASYKRWRNSQETDGQRAKNEALFRSMFPELQPYFHPERLVEFTLARLDRSWSVKPERWENPPGFPAAAIAEIKADERDRERVRLLDAAGQLLSDFTFEKHDEGGALRVGKGKLTVDTRKPQQPRVRYWHPDREFKWSQAGWVFKTPVADEPFESSSSSSSFTSSTSDSSRSTAAAGFAGLGGTFDGGGASAGWDAAASGTSGGESGSGAAGGSSESASSDSTGGSGSTAY